MKKALLSLILILLAEALQAYNRCKCESFTLTTYTVIYYHVEGGCCSGIAVQGPPSGSIAVYETNEGLTWIEVSYNFISNEFAQSECCD